MIEKLRTSIAGEEFDYQALLESLKDYTRPRDKITVLLRRGDIIRVKKGIYVFGPAHARRPYSREVLANMIYGPSYVSLEYALHYHGLIPERTESLTSMACIRSRRFQTPVGLFIYRMIPLAAYQTGVEWVQIEGGRAFLIATPEKALADRIRDERGTGIRTQEEMQEYLLAHLRVDPVALGRLDPEKVERIASLYHSRKIQLLSAVVRRQGKIAVEAGHE